MTVQRRNTPHDKLFRAVFSEPRNAVAHFEVCLPPALVAALDLPRARHIPGSWVDVALRDHHSDVLHAVPLQGAETAEKRPQEVLLYTIWEHQSTVDRMFALRAHRYATRLLEDWSREHEGQHLPPVIVMVLYHGEAKWDAPVELEELFALDALDGGASEAIRPFLPKARYLLEELPKDPAQIRSGKGIAHMTLVGLKLGRTADIRALIVELFPDIQAEMTKGEPGLHHIGVFVQYLMVVNPEATPEKLAEALAPMGTEVQEIPLTYGLRMIEQGRQEGRREGRQEGRRKEKLKVARKALAKGMSPAEVADLTELSLVEVQKLAH